MCLHYLNTCGYDYKHQLHSACYTERVKPCLHVFSQYMLNNFGYMALPLPPKKPLVEKTRTEIDSYQCKVIKKKKGK